MVYIVDRRQWSVEAAQRRHAAVKLPHYLNQYSPGSEEHEVGKACPVHPNEQVCLLVMMHITGHHPYTVLGLKV
jgi:hypothetical protein